MTISPSFSARFLKRLKYLIKTEAADKMNQEKPKVNYKLVHNQEIARRRIAKVCMSEIGN